jgi:glycosyltransferase involved in cell wall biosynthesis
MAGVSCLVSAIIPVYNGEAFLAEAIMSILRQGYQPVEIIVVDDGSTDGTAAVAERFGEQIRYTRQQQRGPAAARNTGLGLARGDFIAFLDADDLWPPAKLRPQVDCLIQHPEVGVSMGCTQVLQLHVRDGQRIEEVWVSCRAMLLLSAALVRTTVFAQIGGFDEALLYGEDIDWFMRVRESGHPIITHPQVTHIARRHTSNMTHQHALASRGLVLALRKSLERRRKDGTMATTSSPGWLEWLSCDLQLLSGAGTPA